MSNKLNETIQDIAIKHGVLLSKDDPILILQTMNDKMLEENRKAQQEMLAQFKAEMENISSQWKEDAKEKAEKILNAALARSKEAMVKLLQESAKESGQDMKEMISKAFSESQNLAHKTSKFSLAALLSAALLTGTCLYLCFSTIF